MSSNTNRGDRQSLRHQRLPRSSDLPSPPVKSSRPTTPNFIDFPPRDPRLEEEKEGPPPTPPILRASRSHREKEYTLP
ncbi:hypothetical protein EJ03DRAFT_329508, partial [Teratosphaeria nubilosa]